MRELYFAYGSNLKVTRMRERVPSAEALGAASLSGMSLAIDKRGADGSAKANLRFEPGGEVWGVVYALDAALWPVLDACEPAYERTPVVALRDDVELEAMAYVSALRTDDPVPHRWYKRLIVEGAREHGLPAAWIRLLEALPER